ncbi:MAG: fructose-6-phosphate aldolase [Roseibacillus sp.]
MKFFVDSATVEDIRELSATGLIDGVTTNPSMVANSGKPILELIGEICEAVEGPVSAEVAATSTDEMIREGLILGAVAPNVAIKLPLTWDGLKACKVLTGTHGLMVNLTLCFSANQALMAAKAGATFVSPFVGRLDDLNIDGMDLIHEIRAIYDNYGALQTEILCASVRTPNHVKAVALAGAEVVTLPPEVFPKLVEHPLTDKGLAAFMADWEKGGQTIEEREVLVPDDGA